MPKGKESGLSDQEPDLAPVIEGSEYPPLLNLAVPAILVVMSCAYAWSLRGITNPEMNLLLLKPLFIVIFVLLLALVVTDIVPSIRAFRTRTRPGAAVPWNERFARGTEPGAGLIVAATLLFSFFGPGDGPVAYVISAFIYLLVVGYLIGDRRPSRLILQAGILAAGLYSVMGVLLGVRL